MADLASATKPIVVIDRTKDGAYVLIAGKAADDTYDGYYYAPTAEMVELGVEIPADEKLPARQHGDAGVIGTFLRQMHAVAQHKNPPHPWTNRLSNPAALEYRRDWIGLDYWFWDQQSKR